MINVVTIIGRFFFFRIVGLFEISWLYAIIIDCLFVVKFVRTMTILNRNDDQGSYGTTLFRKNTKKSPVFPFAWSMGKLSQHRPAVCFVVTVFVVTLFYIFGISGLIRDYANRSWLVENRIFGLCNDTTGRGTDTKTPYSGEADILDGGLFTLAFDNGHLYNNNNSKGPNVVPPTFCMDETLAGLCSHLIPSLCRGHNFQQCCTTKEYPTVFSLQLPASNDSTPTTTVTLPACKEHELDILALGPDGEVVKCHPWLDLQAKLIGPGIPDKTAYGSYNYKFNSARVFNKGGGLFEVQIKALKVGIYLLEVFIVNQESEHTQLFSDTIFQGPTSCAIHQILNSPVKLVILDDGGCAVEDGDVDPLPLCRPGDSLDGRWVTVPPSGCDGTLCEGNIDILKSSNRVWAPYQCHLKLFSPSDISTCFGNKSILIVGDSITEELAGEIVQIYTYKNRTMLTKKELSVRKQFPGRPETWVHMGKSVMGFSFIMASPLGCGIQCIVDHGTKLLRRNGGNRVDVVVALTGVHDIAPINRKPKHFEVFRRYAELLPNYLRMLKSLVTETGDVFWIGAPQGSDKSVCDFLASPRIQLVNDITQVFTGYNNVSYIDYFAISESCACGNIHKGIRFYKPDLNSESYNGFVSRMMTHIVLNRMCPLG